MADERPACWCMTCSQHVAAAIGLALPRPTNRLPRATANATPPIAAPRTTDLSPVLSCPLLPNRNRAAFNSPLEVVGGVCRGYPKIERLLHFPLRRLIFHFQPQRVRTGRHLPRHTEIKGQEVVAPRRSALVRLHQKLVLLDQFLVVVVDLHRGGRQPHREGPVLHAREVAQLG